MSDGKTPFADDATLDYIAKLERENADLHAQLAAKDAEIAAMRPVVDTSIALRHGATIYDKAATRKLSEAWEAACEEYESKLNKG